MDDPDTSGLNLGDDFFDDDLGGQEHDLDGIFDVERDAVVTNSTSSIKDSFPNNLEQGRGNGNDKSSKDRTGETGNNNSVAKSNQKKRRRSSATATKAKARGDDGSAPSWHSDSDKPYRERMVGEM